MEVSLDSLEGALHKMDSKEIFLSSDFQFVSRSRKFWLIV
jgi:hypothetical protein